MLRSYTGPEPPTTDDFWNAWREDYEAGLEPPLPIGYTVAPLRNRLNAPQNLKWREGRFAHQGLAVEIASLMLASGNELHLYCVHFDADRNILASGLQSFTVGIAVQTFVYGA